MSGRKNSFPSLTHHNEAFDERSPGSTMFILQTPIRKLLKEERTRREILISERDAARRQITDMKKVLQGLEKENLKLQNMNKRGGKLLREREDELRRQKCLFNKLVLDCGEAFEHLVTLHDGVQQARKDYYLNSREIEEVRAARKVEVKNEMLRKLEVERDAALEAIKILEVEEEGLKQKLVEIYRLCEDKGKRLEKLQKRTSARDLFIKALEKTHMNNHTVVYLDGEKRGKDSVTKRRK